MNSDRHPPLWTWGAAILLGLAGTATCWAVGDRFGPEYDYQFLNLDRLTAPPGSRSTIVIIGSSRTWCAIEPDAQMSERLVRTGAPAHVVRITKGGATLRDFEELFEILPQTKPAAVLVESDLVTLEPNAFRMPGAPAYAGWREQSRHGFAVLLAPSIVQRNGVENWHPQQATCRFRFDSNLSRRPGALAQRRASTADERAPLIALAKSLRANGIPIVLLDLPGRNDELGKRPAAIVQGENYAMRELLATRLFEHFGDPPKLNPSDFEDAGHLDPKGQARTSGWLASRLTPMLRASGQR